MVLRLVSSVEQKEECIHGVEWSGVLVVHTHHDHSGGDNQLHKVLENTVQLLYPFIEQNSMVL